MSRHIKDIDPALFSQAVSEVLINLRQQDLSATLKDAEVRFVEMWTASLAARNAFTPLVGITREQSQSYEALHMKSERHRIGQFFFYDCSLSNPTTDKLSAVWALAD